MSLDNRVELHTYAQMIRVLHNIGTFADFETYESVAKKASEVAVQQGIEKILLVVEVRFISSNTEWAHLPTRLTKSSWQRYKEFSKRPGQDPDQIPNIYLADAARYYVAA